MRNRFFHQDGTASLRRWNGYIQVQGSGVGDDHRPRLVRQRGFDGGLHGHILYINVGERGAVRAEQ